MKSSTTSFSLNERIASAKKSMLNAFCQGRRPVIFSSFGKESQILLRLAEEIGLRPDVGYFDNGFSSEKQDFAQRQLKTLGDRAFQLVPFRTVTVAGMTNASLGYQFRLKSGDVITIVGATFDDSESPNVACAIQRGLIRKESSPSYEWDSIVCGRRSSECDATVGELFWPSNLYRMEYGAEIFMPLLDWSELDVSSFLQSRNIEVDSRRYVLSRTTIAERPGNVFNPDHIDCCCRCAAVSRGDLVHCPISGANVISLLNIERLEYRSDSFVRPIVMF